VSIYDAIAASILPVLPQFSVGGSTWTVTRASGDGVASTVSVSSAGSKTLYFVRNAVDKLGFNVAGTQLASAEWLCFARLGVDIRVNDVCVSSDDSTRAFRITGAPQKDFGFLFAPCASVPAPEIVTAGYGFLLADSSSLLLSTGDHLLLTEAATTSLFLLSSGDSLLLSTGDNLLLGTA
jgi:hypothetical protein